MNSFFSLGKPRKLRLHAPHIIRSTYIVHAPGTVRSVRTGGRNYPRILQPLFHQGGSIVSSISLSLLFKIGASLTRNGKSGEKLGKQPSRPSHTPPPLSRAVLLPRMIRMCGDLTHPSLVLVLEAPGSWGEDIWSQGG